MYCSKCGKENSNSSKFCQYCGNELKQINNHTEQQDLKKMVGALGIIVSILVCIIGIQLLVSSISSTRKDIKERTERAERFINNFSFNCPYCRKMIDYDKRDLFEYNTYYSGYCPNCKKRFNIDKSTNKITLDT